MPAPPPPRANGAAAARDRTPVTTNPAGQPTASANGGVSAVKPTGSPNPALTDPKVRAQIAEVRRKLHETIGQVTLVLSALPRYRHMTLQDLQGHIVEPLLRDRLVVATAVPKDNAPSGLPAREPGSPAGESEGATKTDTTETVGIAIWATVSPEVDAKIREQITARVFPVKLGKDDWTSGDKSWLLDVIAPTPKLATQVLASFSKLVKSGELNVHPVAAKQVDPGLLKRLAGEGK